MTDNAYRVSVPPIVEKLGWQTINDLIESETIKMVYKSINQQAPEYLASMLLRLSEISKRQLRDSDTDLHVPFKEPHVAKKSFSYRGTKLWNYQNTEAKKAKSFAHFKKPLKNDRS